LDEETGTTGGSDPDPEPGLFLPEEGLRSGLDPLDLEVDFPPED